MVGKAEVDSTQDEAFRVARDVGPLRGRWLVVHAAHQTAGRGRRANAWHDAVGQSLLLTVAVELAAPTERWPLASLVAGAALAQTLRDLLGVEIALKWPNDLLLQRDGAWRKLGGCLAERRVRVGAPPLWIFGFGLNLRRDGLDDGLAAAVAAIADANGDPDANAEERTVAGDRLAPALLQSLRTAIGSWQSQGWRLPTTEIDALLAFVGSQVTLALDDAGAHTTGLLLGVDADGQLRLRDETGVERRCLPLHVLDANSEPPWHAPPPRARS